MKKNYLVIIILFLSVAFAKAQKSLTTAVDFTVTDTHGNSHNLYSILNSGKYVCLDFFFTTCVPCQLTCPYYKETFTNYGCNTQDIFFLSIDYGNTDAQVDAYEVTYLGGNAGYPTISGIEGGGTAVCDAYGLTGFPTYMLIAPNKQIIETDMWPISSAASFDTYFNSHSLAQKTCLPAGIIESTPLSSISFYPNPAVNNVIIETSDNEKMNTVKIYDVLGKLITHQNINKQDRYELDVIELEKGLYYIEVTTENNTIVSRKFSKQ